MSRFFIHRPIFAIVISIIIVILGVLSGLSLPIAQYPQITQPTVNVSTTYTGANASVINQAVAQVIEQQVNGTQGLAYMSSSSDDTGTYNLDVKFDLGTNGDMDSVLVQNNVAIATSSLPSDVQAAGVTTKKASSDMSYMFALYSPNGTFKRTFIMNYASIYIIDAIKRIKGVGDVSTFGSDYAMRIWLNPDRLSDLGLTVGDVEAAIKEQNVQKTLGISNRGTAPLIISNITFANGLFSVKEELPITIEESSYKTITIVCNAKDEGDISTNMEIYTNDPQKRLYVIKITGDVFTPDYLTGTAEANRTGVKLNVELNNYSDIYGIQFDINTTKEFSVSSDNVSLTERGKNLSVSINSISEGKLRVVAYAKNDQFISGGEGQVITIKLVPKTVLPEGDYTMTLSNIVLGSKGMKNVYAGTAETAINYSVSGAVPGDANKDGKVGIGELPLGTLWQEKQKGMT